MLCEKSNPSSYLNGVDRHGHSEYLEIYLSPSSEAKICYASFGSTGKKTTIDNSNTGYDLVGVQLQES